MSEKLLTCAEVDELLPDFLEGELEGARLGEIENHISTCARCQGLVRDIDEIREAAAAMPDLVPSRDLWAGIESRIEPAVVSITQRREGIHISRRMLGIAAAALVVISSSVTYVATRPEPRRIADNPREVPDMTNTGGELGPAVVTAPAQPAEVESAPAPANVETPSAPARVKPVPSRQPSVGTLRNGASNVTVVKNAPKTPAEAALAPEIDELQAVLRQRRSQLDPSTVKIVEDNLALIDAAVKQARDALQRDPASGFLTEQLDNALQKKIELLRTVTALPSRS
jgi:anti-sigma factor RsiW